MTSLRWSTTDMPPIKRSGAYPLLILRMSFHDGRAMIRLASVRRSRAGETERVKSSKSGPCTALPRFKIVVDVSIYIFIVSCEGKRKDSRRPSGIFGGDLLQSPQSSRQPPV